MTFTLVPTTGAHEDRMGAYRDISLLRLAVLHTTEGWEGVDRAEQLVAACKAPGDRVSSSGSRYGSSYHATFDTDCVRNIVPFNRVSFSAPGANNDGIHGCFPGRVSQTRQEWLDPISTGLAIEQCAMWLLWLEENWKIPAVRLTDAQVKAGAKGYCDHWTISRVYKQTDHTDLGATFPWDHLAQRIEDLRVKPDPEPEVPPVVIPPVTPTPSEDTLVEVITNSEQFFGNAPGVWKGVVMPNGKPRHMLGPEWDARGNPAGRPLLNSQIAALFANGAYVDPS